MRIVSFHLLNDFSGSPKVLKQLLKGWQTNGIKTVLFTNKTDGFLSNLSSTEYHFFHYKFKSAVLIRLANFFYSQFILFFKALLFLKKADVVYCNTILPFGGAMAGRIKGCKVVCHIHETQTNQKLLDKLLRFVIRKTANKIIYVSNFVASHYDFKIESQIISNAIEDEFIQQAAIFQKENSVLKNVLMVCSLKAYKGINEFVKLAETNSQFQFELVLNHRIENVNRYFANQKLPANLMIYPKQTNVHPFYQKADIVLNLTRIDLANETFGLTVIEAMAYGLPVIVPTIGGIAELVTDGENGYKIDSRNIAELSEKLNQMLQPELYKKMSTVQKKMIHQFEEKNFIHQNLLFITK